MFENVKQVLVEELNVNADAITMEAELIADLGINSLDLADFVYTCESKFNIEISDDELRDFVKIQKGLERISITVETLQLWAEQMMANGRINMEQYHALTGK